MNSIQQVSEYVGIYENQSGVQFLALLEPTPDPWNPPKLLFAIQILGRRLDQVSGPIL